MNGYIWLDRKIFEWEHFADDECFRVFIILIMLADWQGDNRGKVKLPLAELARICRIEYKRLTYIFAKLRKSGEIETHGKNKDYTIVIVNYNKYQQRKSTQNQTEDFG